MKRFVLVAIAVFCFNSTASAEDSMKKVFEEFDDLIIRVESGISLNSFAESFASMKMRYSRSIVEPDRVKNYILEERMKKVFGLMNNYAAVWRVQEVDNFKFTKTGDSSCSVQLSQYVWGYDVACQKALIMSQIKPLIESSKTAHFDGW